MAIFQFAMLVYQRVSLYTVRYAVSVHDRIPVLQPRSKGGNDPLEEAHSWWAKTYVRVFSSGSNVGKPKHTLW